MGASTRWTAHIKDKEKANKFKERLKANRDLFELLSSMLEKDLEALYRKAESEDNYSLPAWKEYQADLIGARRTLKKVIKLINFGDKNV